MFRTIIAKFTEKEEVERLKLIWKRSHVRGLSLDWQRVTKLLAVGQKQREQLRR